MSVASNSVYQDFIEYAGGIQLARRVQKQREFLQIGSSGRDLHSGNLRKELARGVRSLLHRVKHDVNGVTHAKLEPVIALQRFTLHTFTVDEGPVRAPPVHHEKSPIFRKDDRVIAGDTRIRDGEIFINLTADRKRAMIQLKLAFLIVAYEYKRGRNTRSSVWLRSNEI